MYAYSNNGLSFRAVAANYVPQSGEMVFSAIATPQELEGAFSGYAAAAAGVTAVQEAQAALLAGIVVVSTGTPGLDGTYPIDPQTQVKLNSAITYIMLNNAFPPAYASSMVWYDMEGAAHTFTSLAAFKAFATAFADYVAHIDIYASSAGELGSLPSNEITIP